MIIKTVWWVVVGSVASQQEGCWLKSLQGSFWCSFCVPPMLVWLCYSFLSLSKQHVYQFHWWFDISCEVECQYVGTGKLYYPKTTTTTTTMWLYTDSLVLEPPEPLSCFPKGQIVIQSAMFTIKIHTQKHTHTQNHTVTCHKMLKYSDSGR